MSKRSVVIIAAHPDDEILGCGGTVALHAKVGDEVTSIIMCEGESLRYSSDSVNLHSCTLKAAEILGVKNVYQLNFPDQQLDTFSLIKLIAPLENFLRKIKPQVIYCQYGNDLNRDHQLLFKAALVAMRPIEEYIETIYAFETPSSTEWAYPRTFIPDTWVDISSTLHIKLKALSCYYTEIREYPHPRSLKAIEYRARAWGNQVVMDAAEVFMTIRRVLRNGKTPI